MCLWQWQGQCALVRRTLPGSHPLQPFSSMSDVNRRNPYSLWINLYISKWSMGLEKKNLKPFPSMSHVDKMHPLIPLNRYSIFKNLYLLLPQALTKDKPLTILFHQCILHNMFRLAPWSHGILLTTECKIISHKKQLWGLLSLSLKKFIVIAHKRGPKG